MEELTDEELKKILKKLVGRCYPYGDTRIDEERYVNLLKWGAILYMAYDEIIECPKFRNDNRYSVNKIGTKANEILKTLREYIDIELEDEEDEEIE